MGYIRVNGVVARVLFDTGCSAECLAHPKFVERAGLTAQTLQRPQSVTLGDGGSKCEITQYVKNMNFDINGYKSMTDQTNIMVLGEFDLVLGSPWFMKLENKTDNKELTWKFNKKQIIAKIKGKKINLIKLTPEIVQATRYNTKIFHNVVTSLKGKELNGGKMIMLSFLDPSNPTLVQTIAEDEYLPVGNLSEHFPMERDDQICITEKNSRKGEKVKYNNIEPIVQADGKPLIPDERFVPQEWDDNMDSSDYEIFSRVDNGKNTPDALSQLSLELLHAIKDHGKVFSDWVKVSEIPDRKNANVRFKFHNPEPFSAKPYKLSPAESKAVAEILQDML